MTWRRLAGALAVTGAYVVLAAISGHLSPIARRPVLDGLGPVAPYRWVAPPPELAAGNVPPARGDFEIRISAGGSEPAVFITADNQVTVVVDRGTFPSDTGDSAVRLLVTPMDPARLGLLPGDLVAFGNVLAIRARFEPTGKRVPELREPLRIVAVYPVTQDLHASSHELRFSPDGETWTAVDSSDAPGLQQVDGTVPRLGYVVVAGVPTPNPIVPSLPDQRTNTLAIVLLLASAGALAIGAALLIRGRTSR